MNSVSRLRVLEIKSQQISERRARLSGEARDVNSLLRRINFKKAAADDAVDQARQRLLSRTSIHSGQPILVHAQQALVRDLKLLRIHQAEQSEIGGAQISNQKILAELASDNKKATAQIETLERIESDIVRTKSAAEESVILEDATTVKIYAQGGATIGAKGADAPAHGVPGLVAFTHELGATGASCTSSRAEIELGGNYSDAASPTVTLDSPPPISDAIYSSVPPLREFARPPALPESRPLPAGFQLFSTNEPDRLSLTHTLTSGDPVALDISSPSRSEVSVSLSGHREESRRLLRARRAEITQLLSQLGFDEVFVEVSPGSAE